MDARQILAAARRTRDHRGADRPRGRVVARFLPAVAMLLGLVAMWTLGRAQQQSEIADYGGYRPHYQGYGVETRGGRGGTVRRVTTLADSGPGSLREALSAAGARFVVFEISGTIRLLTPLVVDNPFVTIAGQTAPSPGILVRGPGLIVDTHDVVVQHLRVRVGNLPGEPHGIWLRDGADRVVLDHVSVSWAVWTSVAVYPRTVGRPTGEVTVMDSLIAEALACSGVNEVVRCDPAVYPKTGHMSNSRGALIGDGWDGHPPAKVAWIRNILANTNDRHPEIGGSTYTILVNNLIYNPSLTPHAAVHFHDGWSRGPLYSVLKGNVLVPGPTTPGVNGYRPPEYANDGEVYMIRVDPSTDPASLIYLEGNYYAKHCVDTACVANPQQQWLLAWEGVRVRAPEPPVTLANLPLSSALPYTLVEGVLTANAGARPLDRDAVDARISHEISSRTGSVPNVTADKAGEGTGADGFPILAVNRRRLTVPASPNAPADAVGRTRIEMWLESMARALERPTAAAGKQP